MITFWVAYAIVIVLTIVFFLFISDSLVHAALKVFALTAGANLCWLYVGGFFGSMAFFVTSLVMSFWMSTFDDVLEKHRTGVPQEFLSFVSKLKERQGVVGRYANALFPSTYWEYFCYWLVISNIPAFVFVQVFGVWVFGG